ncbi:MAG: hypothetical protein VX258_06380 [Pseudomonadota bacterium]|nr:hypothetical protein [Pseudomonadota bacterium]
MESNHKDFLIAEFNKAWDMVLAIDSRRGVFSRYYNILFLAVLAVTTNVLVKIDEFNMAACMGLSLVFVFTYLAGDVTQGILESERAANIRYRKKINLIREILLGSSEEEVIKEYLSHSELGIKLLSQESDQPEGVGRTLVGIYRLILMQKIAMVMCVIGLWGYYSFANCLTSA